MQHKHQTITEIEWKIEKELCHCTPKALRFHSRLLNWPFVCKMLRMRNCSLSGAMVSMVQHIFLTWLCHKLYTRTFTFAFSLFVLISFPFLCVFFVLFLTFVCFRFVFAQELFFWRFISCTLSQWLAINWWVQLLQGPALSCCCLCFCCMLLPLHSISIRHLALCYFVIFYCNFIHIKWPTGMLGFLAKICI